MKLINIFTSLFLVATLTASCGSVSEKPAGKTYPNLTSGNAILSWTAPTTNDDGSQLTDLAGYKVHYGLSPGNYTNTVDVGNVTNYQVNNLLFGSTYYFVITAYSTAGVESDPSSEENKTFSYTIKSIM